MVFRSKMDTFFIMFLLIMILVLGLVMFIPLLITSGVTMPILLTMTFIYIALVSFLLWSFLSIKYVFYEAHLFVKGGLFKSCIPYEKITKVTTTKEIFTGYRILSSKEGLEIFSQSVVLGSVKVSPQESRRFISEVKKRCPNVKFHE